jgi:nitroimidazol reductase NimA-like FMN-containing flavoprotein (pyridoxamine 5'-phosphate oxidase superfamily)
VTANTNAGIAGYLTSHRTGVLATSKKSCAPQLTLIAYHFDGSTFAISTRAPTQKAKNISRRPDVSMAVIDGQRQLIVYGSAVIVRDEAEVLRLHQQRIRQIALRQETDEELAERLRREERVVILFTPRSYYPASLG